MQIQEKNPQAKNDKRHRWARWACLGVLALFFFCAKDAEAAGFLLPDVGSRASSRGGAFIATGDDLTVMWHNPANLARLKGLQVQIDGALVMLPFSFERAPRPGQANPFPTTQNVGDPQPIPFLGVSYDFSHLKLPKMHKLAFGIAVWAPYDGNYVWDQDGAGNSAQPQCNGADRANFTCNANGPQRYSGTRYDPLQVYLGATLAYGLELSFMSLYFGAGIQLVKTEIYQRLAVKLVSQNTATTDDDALVDIRVGSPFQPSANFGMTVAFPFGLSVGASFQLPMSVRMEGTLTAEIPPAFESLAQLEGDRARVSIELPWFLRVGIGYQPSFFDRLKVEVAFVYEQWSSFRQILLDPSDIKINSPIPAFAGNVPIVNIPRNWQDAWSIRAGGELAIIPRYFFMRLGYFYETSAIPDNYFNITAAHTDRHGASIGLEGRIHFGKKYHMALSAAYTHVFARRFTVTDSQERVIVLSQTEEDRQKNPPEVVGNGTYEASAHVFLLSLSFQWDG